MVPRSESERMVIDLMTILLIFVINNKTVNLAKVSDPECSILYALKIV
jgi:hypothetical protein